MWGRGDHNKKGNSGRGAGNQSIQGFGQAIHHGKSYMENRQVENHSCRKRRQVISLLTEAEA